MSIFPEGGPTPQQQAVLDRCPLVNCYLRDIDKVEEPRAWMQELADLEAPLTESLEYRIGVNGIGAALSMASHILTAEKLTPTEENINPDAFTDEIGLLIRIGYEISDPGDIYAISNPILRRVHDFGYLLAPSTDLQTSQRAEEVIRGILLAGSSYSKFKPAAEQTFNSNPDLEIFRRVIEGPDNPETL